MTVGTHYGRDGYEAGFVPAKLVTDLCDRWMENRREHDGETGEYPLWALVTHVFGSHITKAEMKNQERSIRRIRKQEWMGFDRADMFVSRLGGWMQSAELEEAYQKVNLKRIDITNPTCSQVHRENKAWLRMRLKETGMDSLAEEIGMCFKTLRRLMKAQPAR